VIRSRRHDNDLSIRVESITPEVPRDVDVDWSISSLTQQSNLFHNHHQRNRLIYSQSQGHFAPVASTTTNIIVFFIVGNWFIASDRQSVCQLIPITADSSPLSAQLLNRTNQTRPGSSTLCPSSLVTLIILLFLDKLGTIVLSFYNQSMLLIYYNLSNCHNRTRRLTMKLDDGSNSELYKWFAALKVAQPTLSIGLA
jgi:hypothetical protein